ncbi:MAG TPA: GNAT family protein [Actinomycetota bacterium]|jgi:ribosomal-protein-serine acetyltransferase|nr:GNAT family protein [Actinomycetota bacterium]
MKEVPRRALVTERLVLEPIEERWAAPLWDAAEASLKELRRWMPWSGQASQEETLRFARGSVRGWEEGREFDFAVLSGDTVVGGLGLSVVQPEAAVGEVGYWVRTAAAGRGYAVEAARAVVGFGFEEVGLHRIELRAGVENAPSRRVAEKLGFRLEAEGLREASRGADRRYDCCLYALLASDPRP